MEADNDFFEQLKKQSEQLAATPQPQTWQRLESRLKKSEEKKKTNFLSWSFLNISILAAIVVLTITILAYLNYNSIRKNEMSLSFFNNLKKCEGTWNSKINSTEERIQLVNTTPNTISIYKSILFKNEVVNELNFSIQRKANKNYLFQDGKTFIEKKIYQNKIIFQSGVEKIEILNDSNANQIVFIYPGRSTNVYSKNSN